MELRLKRLALVLGVTSFGCYLLTSCIREELPNINLDVTALEPTLTVGAQGIVKTTIQENGVTLYADMTNADKEKRADLTNLDLTVTVSKGATWSYVDVETVTTQKDTIYEGKKYTYDVTDTIVKGEIPTPKDFTVTRYIKVVSEASGIHEDDQLTQKLISENKTGFIGWEKDGVRTKNYVDGAHLYKIWSINVLPAGIPLNLSFDNWASITGANFQQPYENVLDENGKPIRTDIWSSTNASIAIMQKTMPLVMFGSRPTDEVAFKTREDGTENKSALLLTSNDIRYTGTLGRPFLAGCCFIGEFDGSDTGALTCTHVGLPFNKLPESISFYYKYLPMTIEDPNSKQNIYVDKQNKSYSFDVPGIKDYIGEEDKGFIRAVLYRADGDNKWLNGESIRDLNNKDVVAYAEFAPQGKVDTYTQKEMQFTYLQQVNEEDLANWKYNLAIYFASSYDGFRFICGADMSTQYTEYIKYYMEYMQKKLTDMEFYYKLMPLMASQMGSQLFIDEMEIKCK